MGDPVPQLAHDPRRPGTSRGRAGRRERTRSVERGLAIAFVVWLALGVLGLVLFRWATGSVPEGLGPG